MNATRQRLCAPVRSLNAMEMGNVEGVSRCFRLDRAVELGHRQIERSCELLNLFRFRFRVALLDAAQACGVNLGLVGKSDLVHSAQLAPMLYALTWRETHTARLHREQSAVNRDCRVSN